MPSSHTDPWAKAPSAKAACPGRPRVVAVFFGATIEAVKAVYQKICCATLPCASAGSDW